MDEQRFLVLRMSALGDIIHTLPAVCALRDSFPKARIDWLVDRKWSPILEANPCVDHVIEMNRGSWSDVIAQVRRMRKACYTTAIDFQSLYRSAILGRLSGAPRRFGFGAQYSRESGAWFFYTNTISPRRAHKVEHNLELAEAAGARVSEIRFPLPAVPEASDEVRRILATKGVSEYFVLSPGGGWGSKCWPPERYGELHRLLAQKYGWRGVISFGPSERELAERVRASAGAPEPIVEMFDLKQLVALLRGARFLVAGDTGPLHLASALGRPVVGLYGPTDPSRNGPYSRKDLVVRKARPAETTYKRSASPSPAMLTISVEDAFAAVERRLKDS
jgi:heptosyltransferase I